MQRVTARMARHDWLLLLRRNSLWLRYSSRRLFPYSWEGFRGQRPRDQGDVSYPVTEGDARVEGVVDGPKGPQEMRRQNEVVCLVNDLVNLLLRDSGIAFQLLFLQLLQVLVDEEAPLRFRRKASSVGVEVRVFGVRVVEHPFAEVVRDVEGSVVVATVLEVDQDDRVIGEGGLLRWTKVGKQDVTRLQVVVTEADGRLDLQTATVPSSTTRDSSRQLTFFKKPRSQLISFGKSNVSSSREILLPSKGDFA